MSFFTDEEKLTELRLMITTRDKNPHGQRRTAILKSLAADLQAKTFGSADAAIVQLTRALVAVSNSKTTAGFDPVLLDNLAREMFARWPVIRDALMAQRAARKTEEKIDDDVASA